MKIKSTARLLGITTVALLALTGCAGTTPSEGDGAAETVEIRLSLNQTEEHPNYLALTSFADEVREKTDGRVDVQIFPNAVLGAQQESVQLVGSGAVDAASISGTQMNNLNEDFAVLDMPLVFDSEAHQMKAINDPAITGDLFKSLESSNKLTIVGAYTQGARSVYNSQNPVETPADLAGVKVRVQESELHVSMLTAMGGSPAPMAFGEVYTALQSGVIDGAENNSVSYVTEKHYEVAPYFSYTRHLIGADFLVLNSDVFNSLSDEDQQIVSTAFLNSVDEFMSIWDAQSAEAVKTAEAAGSTFNEVDADAFRAVLEPMVDDVLDTDDKKALYDAIRAAA